MTDYCKMSDFEINRLVAISRLPGLNNWDCFDISGRAVFVNSDGKLSHERHSFSFTSHSSDAWPIIVDAKIGITPPFVLGGNWEAMTFDSDGYVNKNERSSNPLRAAMIVYLMMKEGDNDRS